MKYSYSLGSDLYFFFLSHCAVVFDDFCTLIVDYIISYFFMSRMRGLVCQIYVYLSVYIMV